MKSHSSKVTQAILQNGSLAPLSDFDCEIIVGFKEGQLFNLVPVSNRSEPMHRKYWVVLARVVEATGKWATTEHLHNDLKMLCGYYHSVINGATGAIYYIPDSISFAEMDQNKFQSFFDAVMEKLIELIGYDPIE